MLKEITSVLEGVRLNLLYATKDNLTNDIIYKNAFCFLHTDAYEAFLRACSYAKAIGYGFTIFDGFRPSEAQWKLWEACPDSPYVADPRKGSAHSRGVAIDLTLYDLKTGQDLDMGTGFDALTPLSSHGETSLSIEVQKNRLLLLGIMVQAGYSFYNKEWWHYQLPEAATKYPLLSDKDSPKAMMG